MKNNLCNLRNLWFHKNCVTVILILLLLTFTACACAQQLRWDNKQFMDVKEIHPGMTGYGLTVFQGTAIERFTFTVIAVLCGHGLDTEMVMVRLTSGKSVEKNWGIVEGMSGSPLYIEGRLIGALALGQPYAQEPIAGVTPIREMLESYEPGAVVNSHISGAMKPRDGSFTLGKHRYSNVLVAKNPADAVICRRTADAFTLVLQPVATPLMVTGMSEQQLRAFAKTVEPLNFTVIPGIIGGYVDKSLLPAPVVLQPGASVACAQIDGDVQVVATGTVTYRKGNVILAFGHSLAASADHPSATFGDVRFPMYTAYVYDVFAEEDESWKIISPIERVGAITRDGVNAVGGVIGLAPRMVPVDVTEHNVVTGYQRKFHVAVAELRPFTAQWIMESALLRPAIDLGPSHIDLDWGIYDITASYQTDKYGLLRQHSIASPKVGGTPAPFIDQYAMLEALLANPYEKVAVKHVTVNVDYTPNADTTGRIESVTPDCLVARPGDTVNLTVKIRRFDQQMETRQLAVKVPENYACSMLAIGVIGGAEVGLSRQVQVVMPARAEGEKGLLRLLSGELSGRRLLLASFQPEPSYTLDGQQLLDLPAPLSDLLPLADLGASHPLAGAAQLETGNFIPNQNIGYPRLRPTVQATAQDDPLLISGGQLVNIAIDNGVELPGSATIGYTMPGAPPPSQPLLSFAPPRPAGGSLLDYCQAALQFTPDECRRDAEFFTALNLPRFGEPEPFAVPALALPGDIAQPLPLSCTASIMPLPMLPPGTAGTPVPVSKTEATPAPAAAPEESATTTKTDAILSAKQPLLRLAEAKDFARGRHFGTAVTAHGRLTLAPSVQCPYRPKDFLPWKIAVGEEGVYTAGWGSNQVIALHGDNLKVIFPRTAADGKNAHSVSALTVDGNGNVLQATWPDQTVRLLTPFGMLLERWTLPVANIWDLAVTSEGKRYAACAGGVLYSLSDDEKSPLHLACTVPDQHIFALAVDTRGNLYFGTSPRGLIYRLSAEEKLTAIYQATDRSFTAVTSLAVDKVGNVYAGLSPSCGVLRIAPDGAVSSLMTGAGKDNKHVLALALLGDDLYAATSLSGGIYRIIAPAGADPDVTIIYAREDTRTTDAGEEPGPESLAVTDLAVDNEGALYASAAFPAQVLKLVPRSEGCYHSPVLHASATAKWGAVRLVSPPLSNSDAIQVDTRGGATSEPDATWSAWTPLALATRKVAGAPAPYLQFRLHLAAQHGLAPALEELCLPYQQAAQPPTVKFTELKSGAYLSGQKELKWEAASPDNDPLVSTVFLSADNGTTWKPVYPYQAPPATKPNAKT